jgi:hypothetical protein
MQSRDMQCMEPHHLFINGAGARLSGTGDSGSGSVNEFGFDRYFYLHRNLTYKFYSLFKFSFSTV